MIRIQCTHQGLGGVNCYMGEPNHLIKSILNKLMNQKKWYIQTDLTGQKVNKWYKIDLTLKYTKVEGIK